MIVNPVRPFPRPRRALTALTALAAACALVAAAPAARAQASWSLIDLGTLYGEPLFGQALNNRGQVTGFVQAGAGEPARAFLWQGGSAIDLGTLGGPSSQGTALNGIGLVVGLATVPGGAQRAFLFDGIALQSLGTLGGGASNAWGVNDAMQVSGWSMLAGDTALHAFRWDAGTMVDLGTLGGTNSYARGINADGHVTGSAQRADGRFEAFVHRGGAMLALGTAGGGESHGVAINDRGEVAGYLSFAGGLSSRAFRYSQGVMTNLGTLGGDSSAAWAINASGVVVGSAGTATGASRAFLYGQDRVQDLNGLPGVAGTGWELRTATAINDAGQILAQGENASGVTRTLLLTLDTTVWQGAPGARWDDAAAWSYGIAPNRNSAGVIAPESSRRMLGPAGQVVLRSLTVGGESWATAAVATLELAGGEIVIADAPGSAGITISARGVLAGQGTIRAELPYAGVLGNEGRIVAGDLTLSGVPLYNFGGRIEGDGRIGTDAGIYNFGGSIAAPAGGRLLLEGYLGNSLGTLEARRGELAIAGTLDNFDRVLLLDGTLRSQGLQNFSRIDIGSGSSDVFGGIINQADGRIVVSGEGQATFWDRVENHGELRVSARAVATFFGDFLARGGSTLTGAGAKYFEAGFAVGDSPGVARVEGDVVFGSAAVVEMEIGGAWPGSGDDFHDQLIVEGLLTLGGTLVLTSWNGFEAAAGQRFDLFDWGLLEGRFDAIDSSGLALAGGTWLDLSQLYVDGSVAVVPEPAQWAMWLLGLAAMGGALGRRRQGHDRSQPQP